MEKLAEKLADIAEINDLIQSLQESMELFERGSQELALEKINDVMAGLEDLKEEELSNQKEVEANLDHVLGHLEWIRQNADETGAND
jgi:predicted component of type VI protein secretion system